jgi:putative aldouronate transport system substrate-binding protein
MLKRSVMIIAVVIVVAAFAVAGGTGEAAATDQVYEIEFLGSRPSNMPANDEENPIIQAINDALNIEYIHSGFANGDELERQRNIRIAGGNPPDMFFVSTKTDMVDLVRDGAILELTPYEDQLPNWKAHVNDDRIIDLSRVDGKLYCLVQPSPVNYDSMFIRQDWLDAVEMDVPQTIDEALEVAKAFTFDDPDGNGKDDTFGLSGVELDTFRFIMGGYGLTLSEVGVKVENGRAVFDVYDPAYRTALGTIKEFIDAGVVDPEVFTHKTTDYRNKVYQGRVGMIAGRWPFLRKPEFASVIKDVNPNATWVPMQPPAGPRGSYYGAFSAGTRDFVMMPVQLGDDEGKLSKVLEFVEFMASEEGLNLVSYGIEGEHYDVVDGQIVAREKMFTDLGWSWALQILFRKDAEYLAVKFPYAADDIAVAVNYPFLTGYDKVVSGLPQGFNKADADRFILEETIKFVYGNRPISEFPQFIQTLDDQFAYRSYTEYVTEQMVEMDLVN